MAKESAEPKFRILPGLPPYGPMAAPIPQEWGHRGQEGLVVEFDTGDTKWVANFQPGDYGIDLVSVPPDRKRVVVISSGDLWIVQPESRAASMLGRVVFRAIEVENPNGWILSRQDLRFERLGPHGILWRTRRLSWDGFKQVRLEGEKLVGLAWRPDPDSWHPFEIDIRTGGSVGGTYDEFDASDGEALAHGQS